MTGGARDRAVLCTCLVLMGLSSVGCASPEPVRVSGNGDIAGGMSGSGTAANHVLPMVVALDDDDGDSGFPQEDGAAVVPDSDDSATKLSVANIATLSCAEQTDTVITVAVPSFSDTSGVLSLWSKGSDGQWDEILSAACFVGKEGVGESSEGVAKTPMGLFDIDAAFGIKPDPGCALDYRQVQENDWWVSDPESPLYNTYVTSPSPSESGFEPSWGEHLIECGHAYDYALDIASNPGRVPYAGSAIFLHVSEGRPTQGCVSVDEDSMVALMRTVSPGTKVAIGTPATIKSL